LIELKKNAGLRYVILRPALVYGPGDLTSITPRLVIAAVYKQTKEKMQFLWDKDLKINTVHVRDVVSAIWHVANNSKGNGEVYNLADSTNLSQGSLCPFLEQLFGIKTDFLGTIQSKAATALAMKHVAETANDKHLSPWSEITKKYHITSTPLTPYLDEELLYNNDLAVDGSAITETGFKYQYPQLTLDLLRESLDYHIKNGSFPKECLEH